MAKQSGRGRRCMPRYATSWSTRAVPSPAPSASKGQANPWPAHVIRGSGEGEGHSQNVEAVSDDQGRYRLSGLPVAASAQLQAFHQGHLPALVSAPAGEGLAPSNVDFDLARGLVVRGKVTEQTTGKPVFGLIVYQPLVGNTFYHDNPSGAWFKHVINGDPIQEDGTYEVLVGPGPGAILVQAQDHPRRTGGPTPVICRRGGTRTTVRRGPAARKTC